MKNIATGTYEDTRDLAEQIPNDGSSPCINADPPPFRHLRRVTRSYKTLYDVPIHKFRHTVLDILCRTV